MHVKLTPEEVALANKARARSLASPNDPTAGILRYAHPVGAAFVVPKGDNEFEVNECAVPDLESLKGVIDQGFDPHGPCGPTYWRITASHYYSTMLTEKGIWLSITKLRR